MSNKVEESSRATRTPRVMSWDGIEEFDNPMPRWWLWTFYAHHHLGHPGYTIAYPAWPMINSATAGVLGWSTRGRCGGGNHRRRRSQRADECQVLRKPN